MKKIIGLLLVVLLFGCDSDKGWDCTKTAGKLVQQEVPLGMFDKVTVWEGIQLFVQEGEEQKVVVESGANLINDIDVKVSDGRLELKNNTSCDILRDYGLTKVYVTSPNITEIRNSSEQTVESIGVLAYPLLSLSSEDYGQEGSYYNTGDFVLELDVEMLRVVANGYSHFYLSGKAQDASFGLYAGDCRIYSENLIVQNLNVYHRSTGPMVVNPQESIRGQIVSLGDVISKNRPPIVEVEELYRGRLIFD